MEAAKIKTRILVTGANGQLGKCIQDVSGNYPSAEFFFTDRNDVPVDDVEKTRSVIKAVKPNVIINAAAYTAVDKAEMEIETAFLVNGDAVGNLATICRETGARLLHVSTDYVFNGEASSPYKETDAVSPVNKYGASKLAGEEKAIAADPSSIIVRTSWVYSIHGNNFVKTMMRLMKERESINVVNDQYGCPTYAIDLANALLKMAMEPKSGGIYHFSNSGPITWFEFAKAIAEIINSNCTVNPVPSSSFPTPAKRPAYSVMSNDKIISELGIQQLNWNDRLRECISLIK